MPDETVSDSYHQRIPDGLRYGLVLKQLDGTLKAGVQRLPQRVIGWIKGGHKSPGPGSVFVPIPYVIIAFA